ncbi:MAG: argininosuccinate lyase [Ignavibacteriae bacterium]|nr:argininosuccinate lyase [Ignavibacteriota bacterium]
MTIQLWNKTQGDPDREFVHQFTAGRDSRLDLRLAPFDVLGSIAHVMMLESVGLLDTQDARALRAALRVLYHRIAAGEFVIEQGVEDVHSQIELELTRQLGDAGRRVHTGRSRNDQVLLDLKLYLREALRLLVLELHGFAGELLALSDTYRDVALPGYTHLQAAMPSSFGLWFAAYAECLAEDVTRMHGAYALADRNPLGSAAGYGSSFPLDREMTTRLLCFGGMHVNAVAAQMGRGRTERAVAEALAAPASTLARLAMDAVLFMSQNFGFISFPGEWTTGSSIMPHKKNPDVLELVRARCNRLQALPNTVALTVANLPSGYHRDMQELKEILLPAVDELAACLQALRRMFRVVHVRRDILDDRRYAGLFSVEAVDTLVRKGVPFREAYHEVAQQLAEGTLDESARRVHTHTGSAGNLRNDLITRALDEAVAAYRFERLEGLAALIAPRREGTKD